ncbi:DeoR family transcriptional regulator [Geomicrobium sp. JCM 19039]|uniref:DeoR family transcriptional regulator n=1 Tax=Geomicrobium sp. JCM 19039 TaxID=1460636 RepID=UPI00045F4CA1|nr:DeoR family transcriptional regulator [Geomicrobium sp. JCM 19039]GAK10579.1 transcriptional regulator, DeoR family [Geomicrobium sp. JCM 19039]
MYLEERRDTIVEMLKAKGRVSTKELSEKFGISIDSVRRDLSMMEELNLLKRTHGGLFQCQ